MMVAITAPSKTFNLAAGQNSIVMIPDEEIRKTWDDFVNRIRLTGGNGFGYVAAEAAYAGGAKWLDAINAQLKENYEYARDTFAKELPEVVVSPLEGTYLLWIDLRAYIKPEDVIEVIEKKCKLAIDHGDWFGGERFKGFIRMNLATSLENVKIGVESLVRNLK